MVEKLIHINLMISKLLLEIIVFEALKIQKNSTIFAMQTRFLKTQST
jgi:hypothetical protein